MAEVVLHDMLAAAGLADQVVVDSAGTGAWHLGHTASSGARGALARRGYRSAHVARQFEPGWFAERDLVLALDAQNAADLRRLAPDVHARGKVVMLGAFAGGENYGIRGADPVDELAVSVPDPYGGTDDDFDSALALIERACAGFVAYVREVGAGALLAEVSGRRDAQTGIDARCG
jgi:protein-tyrosine phosphatase